MRQFIVHQIAKVAPASGLKVSVGRIEGSVLWNATLYAVKFRDARGKLFLTVPAVELNWRPYKFPFSGLDVRALVLHDGTLYAKPELNPGDPNAPTLPNFDIRVDRFVIDDLTVYENLEIPLSYRNVPRKERESIVCDTLDRFQIVGKRDLYPSQLIQPKQGEVLWFVDEAAASKLSKRS